MICVALMQMDNNFELYEIVCFMISVLSCIHLIVSMVTLRKRLKKSALDHRIGERINSKRYRLCIIGNLCMILLFSMYFMPIWLEFCVFFVVLIFFWCTTALTLASTQMWFFAFFSCRSHISNDNVRMVAWLLLIAYGFVMIEIETRRIAKCSKWKTLRFQEYWVRGCFCANCLLKGCCWGIYENA